MIKLHFAAFFWCCALICGLTTQAAAKNPTLSSWETDISYENPTYVDGNYMHEMIESGGNVHVMWAAQSSDAKKKIIYHRRSSNKGETWEPTTKVVELANDQILDTRWEAKRMVVSGNKVFIFFATQYWGGALKVSISQDNGATFATPVTIYSNGATNNVYSFVARAIGARVDVSIMQLSKTKSNCSFFIVSSDDGGATWNSNKILNVDNPTDNYEISDMASEGINTYILYKKTSDNEASVHLLVSNDAGSTFTNHQLSIPNKNGVHKAGVLQDSNFVSKISCNDNKVAVVFNCQDAAENIPTIFLALSQDRGNTFRDLIAISVENSTKVSIQPGQETVASNGENWFTLFTDTASRILFQPFSSEGVKTQSLRSLTDSTAYGANWGWWPTFAQISTNAGVNQTAAIWDGPSYMTLTNEGEPAQSLPTMAGTNLYRLGQRTRVQIDNDKTIHILSQKKYYSTDLCNGWCPYDIFYRRLPVPIEPSQNNKSILFVNENRISSFDQGRNSVAFSVNEKLNTTTSAITVEAIIYLLQSSLVTDGSYNPFMFKMASENENSDAAHPFAFGLISRNGALYPYAHLYNENSGFDAWLEPAETTSALEENIWTHLAFTFDSNRDENNFCLYVNGILVASQTAKGILPENLGTLLMGYLGNLKLDEVRVWSKARTQTEIAAKSNKSLTGNEEGLIAYYNFNDTTKDISAQGFDSTLMFQESYSDGAPLKSNNNPTCLPAVNLLLLTE